MLEIGDEVELVFSTIYVDGLYPGVRGKVTERGVEGVGGVLWDTGLKQKLERPGADTYRITSRAFSTESQGDGRLIMQFLGIKAVPPPPPPKVGDRVEFLFSTVPLGRIWLYKGCRGTVYNIDERGVIHVKWDEWATLIGLIPGWDHFRILPKNMQMGDEGCDDG